MMADARLGPKMQEWQVEHTNLYLKSGGKEGHVMKPHPAIIRRWMSTHCC